eukprot:gnl/TRDRNA2_/TRDRNA2_178908_c0_seq1.p1 gnl/TRDRNA2_/TRDRNA2_178908_c0~~gnl/TRDRNA2_/TRDRNA2_178908_c0_seq1.p1  ORF type:complete len:441 (+),score=74.26 gnl/TRDRNA2_/TRDRNA2_178908_c0_seq1:114-1436(+)
MRIIFVAFLAVGFGICELEAAEAAESSSSAACVQDGPEADTGTEAGTDSCAEKLAGGLLQVRSRKATGVTGATSSAEAGSTHGLAANSIENASGTAQPWQGRSGGNVSGLRTSTTQNVTDEVQPPERQSGGNGSESFAAAAHREAHLLSRLLHAGLQPSTPTTPFSCKLPILAVLVFLVVALLVVMGLHCFMSQSFDDWHEQRPVVMYLCPELVVPQGFECSFAVPTLAAAEASLAADRGKLHVADKMGHPLLQVHLENDAIEMEKTRPAVIPGVVAKSIKLCASSGQCLAYCRMWFPQTTSAGDKASTLIYDQRGSLFARLGEVDGSTWGLGVGAGASATSRSVPSYGLWVVSQRTWQLYFHGSLAERRLNVTDRRMNLVATVEPWSVGPPPFEGAVNYFSLRVAAQADAGLILCALFALERTEEWQKGSGAVLQGDAE